MAKYRFLHAADLHIDSPLVGLSRKSPDYALRLDNATRSAFDNLVALAIEEECRFLIIAGDVFDGQWRDYRTGLFFADRMRKLKEADIQVFLVLGNHDAENRFITRLDLSDNVRRFHSRKAESIGLDALETTIHGRSFPQRDVNENLALGYPPPVPGHLNIGILHTACDGRPDHAPYAPCKVEQLVNHGYDYWALGHVHAREVVGIDPYIVYPGNIQGRNIRESGAKGATLVNVEDGRILGIEHRQLEVIRWHKKNIDLSTVTNLNALLERVREQIIDIHASAEGRGVALRICFSGTTPLNSELVAHRGFLKEEMEMIAMNISGDLWLEKVEIQTGSPQTDRKGEDPTIAGKILHQVQELQKDSWFEQVLKAKLDEIRVKTPAAAQLDDFFDGICADAPGRALRRVQSLMEQAEEESNAV